MGAGCGLRCDFCPLFARMSGACPTYCFFLLPPGLSSFFLVAGGAGAGTASSIGSLRVRMMKAMSSTVMSTNGTAMYHGATARGGCGECTRGAKRRWTAEGSTAAVWRSATRTRTDQHAIDAHAATRPLTHRQCYIKQRGSEGGREEEREGGRQGGREGGMEDDGVGGAPTPPSTWRMATQQTGIFSAFFSGECVHGRSSETGRGGGSRPELL